MAHKIGTTGNDTLGGTIGDDLLEGLAGNDRLKGGRGKDVLDGGAGIDTADYSDKTNAVSVTLAGATSVAVKVNGVVEDTIRNIENVIGGSGNDSLTGGSQANVLNGGAGNDVLEGGSGADTLDGGAGIDTADYSGKTQAVSVTLAGATSVAVKVNGVVEDTIRNIENVTGGSGNDSLTGGSLANVLNGGAGNDVLEGGSGADTLDGGAGIDTADYSDRTQAVSVTLVGATSVVVKVNGVAEDTIRNIENVTGGSGNDSLTGGSQANVLNGGAGNDVLEGGSGADTLDGGTGIDTADYSDRTQAVSVTLTGAILATVTLNGVAEDTIGNIENVTGGSGNDSLTGGFQANVLSGGAGSDVLEGGSGDDTLSGGDGDDVLIGGAGADVLDGGAGTDDASYATATAAVKASLLSPATNTGAAAGDTYTSIEGLTGSGFNDVLTGNSSANTLSGLAGDDRLDGGAGADSLTGGAGKDTFSFTTALVGGNIDTIGDFDETNDTIALSQSIFTAAGAAGTTLSSAAFQLGTAANDSGDRIIFNQSTGALLYDADGTGATAALQFATVSGGGAVGLTFSNIHIV